MKRIPLTLLVAGAACTFSLTTACTDDSGTENSTNETMDDGDGDSGDACVIDGDINADMTLSPGECPDGYSLEAQVFVNDATLTMEPGTWVYGNAGSALVITSTSTLVANGTADMPIVMTSSNADNPAPGDWGGLVLIGNATINLEGGVGLAEGFASPVEYGGMDDSWSCGSLKYFRVEYAGFAISEGNELNGITFYACGSGTTVSYVQSHMGLDDGIEMFGGTFDIDHVVVTGANDDSLDMDQGFRGTASNIVIHQSPDVGDNCFEISNQGSDFDATPKTEPTICNATCIGSGASGDKSKGITIKEGTWGHWYNTAFTNVTNEATNLADEATYVAAEAGNITIHNNNFDAGATHESGADSLDSAGWGMWIWDESRNNTMDDMGLGIDWGSTNIIPATPVAGDSGSPCGTSYVGAADGSDWTAGWVNWVG